MLKFHRKNVDEKTKVRTGILKSTEKSFSTPCRLLSSTELNYPSGIRDVVKDIEYPNDFVLVQVKIDAQCLWTRDSDYYNNVVRQAKRYTSQILDKPCIFKPYLGVYRREKQKDGRYKRTFRTLHNLDLNLSAEQSNRIIRSIVQIADDGEYNAVSLPYIQRLFRSKPFFDNLNVAQRYATDHLTSGIDVLPQLPHTDNVADFEKSLNDYHDRFQEGIICIPNASTRKYRYTHNIVKDFSEDDKSEKIGLMCVNAPRKNPLWEVSHPHYTVLQGYDFVVKDIPMPFQREDGKGAHEKVIDTIEMFNKQRLSIEQFDKGLFFNEAKVNTTCHYFNKLTNKELFRETLKENELDTVLKVMEAFDSHAEMQECQPYITDSDFKSYLRVKQSLNDAFKGDFSTDQKGLSDFF